MQYNGTIRDNVFVCRGQQPRIARDLEHFFFNYSDRNFDLVLMLYCCIVIVLTKKRYISRDIGLNIDIGFF